MNDNYRRKKNPTQVRKALLDSAACLAAQEGLAAVSVQSVSTAAGVTKGGFFHHFQSKQALVDAVFHEMLSGLDREIDELMSADLGRYGRFTRAYTNSVFSMGQMDNNPLGSLCLSMLSDPQLRLRWSKWFSDRLARHSDTDDDLNLEVVRFAADGVWLAAISGVAISEREDLRIRLIDATLSPTESS